MIEAKTEAAPHECTECGSPAYIPFHGPAQCTKYDCPRFHQELWVEHIMELPDSGDPEPELEPDEDGIPQWKLDIAKDHLDAAVDMDIDEEAITEPGIGYASVGFSILDELEKLIDEVPEPFVLTTGSDSTKIEV